MNSVINIFKILNLDQKKKYFLISLFSLIITFIEILGFGLIFPIISSIINPDRLVLILNKINFFNFLLKLEYLEIVKIIILFSIIFYFLKMLFIIILSYIRSRLFYSLIASLSQTVFNGYMSQSLTLSLPQNSSYVTRNIIDFPVLIVNHILNGFYIILFEAIFILCIFSIFIFVNPVIGILILLFVLTFVFIFYLLNKKSLKNYGKKLNEKVTERLKITREAIEGIKEVRMFDKNSFFEKYFKEYNYKISQITTILDIKQSTPKFLLEFLAVLFILSSFFYLLNNGIEFKDIVPSIAVIGAGLVKILPSTNKILSALQRLRSNKSTAKDMVVEMKKFINIDCNPGVFKNHFKRIEIQNLDFGYGNSTLILRNINLQIENNSIFGIKGDSGLGKTTLLNLISGFLNPKKGKVLVDGIEISKNISNWQNLISYIPQKIFIIDDTIEKNICFNKNSFEVDNIKLNKVLELVRLNDFINDSKDGLQTVIGERGSRISAGQAQRVGLARALYKDSKLLILDETTSALDKKTETEILSDLTKMKNDVTIILVSHNSKVLSFCENIYEIKK